MHIKPLSGKEVSDEVLKQIKQNIIEGKWLPGTKIPSELELARLFNVSRVSVREAIHRLIGMGVLTVKKGNGTYVSKMIPSQYFRSLLPILMIERPSLLEVLEFRNILESESARLAAQRATEEDIALLEEIVSKMEQSTHDSKLYSSLDLNFHITIAMISRNSVIVRVTSIIHDILETAMDELVQLLGFENRMVHHRKLVECIKNKDADMAASIMKQHIEDAIKNLTEKVLQQ